MADDGIRIDKDTLTGFLRDIFVSAGVSEQHAAQWADVVIWADLRGADTHGVIRVPGYVQQLANGRPTARPDLRVLKADGAMALVDCDYAPGPISMTFAMRTAIERAREAHVGWCVARRTTHAGAIGYYTEMAARAGMIGMAMTASQPLMAYHGAAVKSVSTNPFSIAAPSDGGDPAILDIATSAISNGQVMRARAEGRTLPDGVAIDADGNTTTDPHAVAALMPLGGPKGAGLSLMIEVLCSLVAGNPVLEQFMGGGPRPKGIPQNGVAIALDISAFRDMEGYARDFGALSDIILGLPKAPGVEKLFLPGGRGFAEATTNTAAGVPVSRAVWDRLAATAEAQGVAVPKLDQE